MLVEPPVVQEPVVVQTEPTVDFLPPVEPVSEPEAVVIPLLFEPTPLVSSPPSYPSGEMVTVGRIITDDEFAASPTPVPQQSVIEPPPVPEIIPPFQSQPLIAVEQPSQSPFGEIAVVKAPCQPQQFGQPQSFAPPASPFQTTPVETIQTPLYGETATFVQSPDVVAPAAAGPKETDRVNELLKQFRERYARG